MRPRRLSTQQMETFRAVMHAGSVHGAARQLGTSQPSLTRILRRMEDLAGFALFQTVKGRLIPTGEARALLQGVEHVHHQLDALEEMMQRIARHGDGPFRFGASPSLGRAVVPAALVGFRRLFPEAELRFDTVALPNVVDYLALGRGECFLTIHPIAHPAIECRAIWPCGLCCLLPAGHRLAGRERIDPAEIAAEELILGEPETPHGEIVRDVFRGIGRTPNIRIVIRVTEAAIGLVAHGHGIAILDEFTALDAASERVVVRPLNAGTRMHACISRGQDLLRSRYAEVLEAEVLGVLRHRERLADRHGVPAG
ncbi:LysR family transcriptional regulator [Roseomonas sp. OT10]|uniref:LysR family transcriptional regulator n=1 Tax=Roseomonas cutis TaxID=2897332 RepID=UPI001E3195ED|nr:LysR family transcriptional regulator [Roseomonas sp. OT10]UFN50516.1 LysR family transcriptional regulator [Roseomonas sp. OT10]